MEGAAGGVGGRRSELGRRLIGLAGYKREETRNRERWKECGLSVSRCSGAAGEGLCVVVGCFG